MSYMNDHLIKAHEGLALPGSPDVWHFQEQHYRSVMEAFTRELRLLVRDKRQRQAFGLILPEDRWPKLKKAVIELDKEFQGFE